MIPTFTGLLSEKFFDATTGFSGSHLEVWVNPTHSELTKISPTQGRRTPFPDALLRYGQPPYNYSAGLLGPTDWYVWERDLGEHRNVVRGLKLTDVAPVYYYYFPNNRALVLVISLYGLPGEPLDKWTVPVVRKRVAGIASMKIFSAVTVLDDTGTSKDIYNPLDD